MTKQMNHSSDKSRFQKDLEKMSNEQKKIETQETKLREIVQIER